MARPAPASVPSTLQVLKFRLLDQRWMEVRFRFQGVPFRAQALVFEEPSEYGIRNGRVSKLWIARLEAPQLPVQTKAREVQVFNYDRRDDVDAAPAGLVDALVAYLEDR